MTTSRELSTHGGEGEDLYQDSALSCEINDPGNPSILEKFKWVKKDEEDEPEEWW